MKPSTLMMSFCVFTAAMMMLIANQVIAQALLGPPLPFVARGFQPDSSSLLLLSGDLIGTGAIWQPLAPPIGN